MTQCARQACRLPLIGENKFRIWNNAGCEPNYREYCVKCGKRIIEANEDFTIKLKYEIIKKE